MKNQTFTVGEPIEARGMKCRKNVNHINVILKDSNTPVKGYPHCV